MNPLFHTEFSISDSLKNVRKSVLIYEIIIEAIVIKANTIGRYSNLSIVFTFITKGLDNS